MRRRLQRYALRLQHMHVHTHILTRTRSWRKNQDVTAHFGVYASAAQQLGFGQKPLYVASGIWTP